MITNKPYKDAFTLEQVSDMVERAFRKDGYVAPVWFACTRDGRRLIAPSPVKYTDADSKDLATAMIRALFEIEDVVEYTYAAESWVILDPEALKTVDLQRGIADHPQRAEVVSLISETEGGRMVLANRAIIRPAKGRARLGPLVVEQDFNGVEGRLVGMLPKRGATQ